MRPPRRRLFLVEVVAIVALGLVESGLRASQSGDLQIGVPATVRTTAGTPALVTFSADAGDFIHIQIESSTRVREAAIADAAQTAVTAYPRIQGGRGAQVVLSAPAGGRFTLRLTTEGSEGLTSDVIVRLVARRKPQPEDSLRLDAARLLVEAQQRAAAATADARRGALDLMMQSMRASEAAKDPIGLGDTWNRIGQLHYTLNEYARSVEAHDKAATYFESIGDLRSKAEALGNAGTAYRMLGNLPKARELQEAVLAIARTTGDRRGEAFTLHNLGAVEYSVGNFAEAIAHYERSLQLKRELGEIGSTAVTLSNLATTYSRMGDAARSAERRREALAIHRATGDKGGAAFDLMAIGIELAARGQIDEGLQHLEEALSIFRAQSNPLGEAQVLHNTATVYEAARDAETAMRLYEEALPLRRKVGDPATLSTTLMRLGGLHLRQGATDKAAAELEEALVLKKRAADRYGEAYVAGHLALLHDRRGDKQRALEFAEQSLELSRAVSDPIGEATALHYLGIILAHANDKTAALDRLQQALVLRQRLRARTAEASTRLEIARIQRELGRLADARATLEPAIATVESLRGGVANPDLRTTFFAGFHEYFEIMVDLLMQEHRLHPASGLDRLALDFSERARARRLLDTLAEATIDPRRGADPDLLNAEARLTREIENTEAAIVRLLAAGHRNAVTSAEARLADQLRELQELRGRIRRANPAYASLRFPEPVPVARLQREMLGPDTALLEFMLGTDRSYLWVVTSDAVRSFELPASGQIERLARTLDNLLLARQQGATSSARRTDRGAVRRADAQQRVMARQLGELLFKDVHWPVGLTRLVFVADGELNTVPFAALRVPTGRGDAMLVERYEVVQLPSLAALAEIRRNTRGVAMTAPTVAVIADPVFDRDDPRLARRSSPPVRSAARETAAIRPTPRGPIEAYGRFERLRFSRAEAQAIAALWPRRSVVALDFAASRDTLAKEPFRSANVLHLATHAVVHPVHPELTGIVLSLVAPDGSVQDGFLRLGDLYNLDVDADLVVLSACETAVGTEIHGEGLQAMSRGFMYAGARRVVATLWQVDDRATSVFMDRFYTALLRERRSPGAALRSAMLSMSRDPRWSSPYYWAGFTLQGDW